MVLEPIQEIWIHSEFAARRLSRMRIWRRLATAGSRSAFLPIRLPRLSISPMSAKARQIRPSARAGYWRGRAAGGGHFSRCTCSTRLPPLTSKRGRRGRRLPQVPRLVHHDIRGLQCRPRPVRAMGAARRSARSQGGCSRLGRAHPLSPRRAIASSVVSEMR